jgi:hypothetical protein
MFDAVGVGRRALALPSSRVMGYVRVGNQAPRQQLVGTQLQDQMTSCTPPPPPNLSSQHPYPTEKHFCNTSEALTSWKIPSFSQKGGCHHSGRMGGI